MIDPKNLKIGELLYEYGYGHEIVSEVITTPISKEVDMGDKFYKQWSWKSKVVDSDSTIDYLITIGLEHYGPNIYDYPAYRIMKP